MNILILGATGRVGSQIVTLALLEGHKVTVLVRDPEKIQIYNENLTIIQGNVLNKDDIVRAMHGIDVVFSALNTDVTTTRLWCPVPTKYKFEDLYVYQKT